MADYIPILTLWWLLFLILGIINLPLTGFLFPKTSDDGWIFSKILAILAISYLAWIFGMTKFIPFSQTSLFLYLFGLMCLNFFILKKRERKALFHFPVKIVIFEEALFAAAFLFWAFVRAHNPDIHDLEKYMDFGFINSILRSDYFPPKDMWLAGNSINYYYFGHLISACIIKILSTPPEVGYNLILALLFALTLSASFSIGFNVLGNSNSLKFRLASGLLSSIILTFLGNLQVSYAFIKGFATYWYPDATRFIPNTIHEFPIYSFVVADLHGHLLDVPLVLLMIFFIYSTFFSSEDPESSRKINYIFIGLLLAVMYMTNSADAVIYFAFFAGLLVFTRGRKLLERREIKVTVRSLLTPLAVTSLSFILFSSPFQLTFKQFTEGVKLAPERSPIWMFLIVWGSPLFFAFSFIATFLSHRISKNRNNNFIFFTCLFSVFLILIPEIIYFKDIYTGQPRANTMFKFGYQAFLLFSLVSSSTIINFTKELSHRFSFSRTIWLFVAFNLLQIMAFYPYFAITSAYGKELGQNIRGLNGLSYLETARPSDFYAIRWINENIKDQPVILEAVGESYTDFARISANTGLPTVLGWPVHEWLWRRDVGITDLRRNDVEQIYTSRDLETTDNLLTKYKVEYVYIGELERQKYPNLIEEKFKTLDKEVYRNESVVIYQIT